MDVAAKIRSLVTASIKKSWPSLDTPSIEVNFPPKEEFGDYTTPVSLGLAKQLGENPMEVAEKIAATLSPTGVIGNITVSKPGFINFFINYSNLAKEVTESEWEITSKSTSVSIEHTSVNPNKAAHVGHLRNAVLGDTLARVLRGLGNKVEVQNYIDDLGAQVADSVVAAEIYGMPTKGEPVDEWFWKIYSQVSARFETEPELKERREAILAEMEEGKNEMAREIVSKIVDRHMETFHNFGINYELLVYEHDIVNNHLWDILFNELQKKKLISQPTEGPHAGAWVVEFGESEREDKILVRSNGIVTYTGKDLAYALWKFGQGTEMPGYEKRLKPINSHVNVIDERQSYPQAVIRHVMEKLGYKKEATNYLHLGYGVVRLSEKALAALGGETKGKSSYSMSGRAGIGVMVNDLYKTAIAQQKAEMTPEVAHGIAIGSIRYYMLRSRPEREIVFDFEDALRSDGNTGVYLQYAYARANNILEKLPDASKYAVPSDLNPAEKMLVKTMAEASYYVEQVATELDPSILCDYAFKLATAFAKFYETSPVMKADEDVRNFRRGLVVSYRKLLGKVLDLLGIPLLTKI